MQLPEDSSSSFFPFLLILEEELAYGLVLVGFILV